jgi:hypothetical protein
MFISNNNGNISIDKVIGIKWVIDNILLKADIMGHEGILDKLF